MAHSDNFINQYFWGKAPTSYYLGYDEAKKQPELTKEEKLKRVEDYIEKYNVEHDDKYIYLYKAVNLDGTNIHQSDNKIIFEVGKVYTEKCDQDVTRECSNGLHAGTYNVALDFGKGSFNSFVNQLLYNSSSIYAKAPTFTLDYSNVNKSSKNTPVNPAEILKQPNFKLFKVKIYKEHVVVPNSTKGKVRCNQMEIMEEIKLENVLKYTLINIENEMSVSEYIDYTLTFDVVNDLNNKSLKVEIVTDTLNLTQDEINNKINARINQMQNIYDKYQELSKFDGNVLV